MNLSVKNNCMINLYSLDQLKVITENVFNNDFQFFLTEVYLLFT